jgi:hypothetical protein
MYKARLSVQTSLIVSIYNAEHQAITVDGGSDLVTAHELVGAADSVVIPSFPRHL